MHAVLVKVSISDVESSVKELQEAEGERPGRETRGRSPSARCNESPNGGARGTDLAAVPLLASPALAFG